MWFFILKDTSMHPGVVIISIIFVGLMFGVSMALRIIGGER